MRSLKKLQQLETAKNYAEYCDLAETILTTEKGNISPTNWHHIRKRKDFYLKKLKTEKKEGFDAQEILGNLTQENLEILKKCCPRFDNEKIERRNRDQKKQPISEQTLLAASITKNKHLKVELASRTKSPQTTKHYFYQALLSYDLKLKQLKSQSAGKFHDLETQLISLDNEFMPVFVIGANENLKIITNLELIYFPSMIPGGYHYSELVDEYSELNLMASLNKYAKKIRNTRNTCKLDCLLMSSAMQDIGIGYANEDFRKWITHVHGIKILKDHDASCKNTILALPQKAYPTISVIINGLQDNIYSDDNVNSVDILIVKEYDHEPQYKLQASFPKLPTKETNKIDFIYPYLLGEKISKYEQYKITREPICVYPGENQAPYTAHPILPFDIINCKEEKRPSKELFAVVNLENPENITEEFILSISQQRNVKLNKVIFISSSKTQKAIKKKLQKIASDWQVVMHFHLIENINEIGDIVSNGSNIMIINENILLQDLNILSILESNLIKYSAFSSGCIVTNLSSSKKRELYDNVSCGLHPTFNSFSQSGRLTLEAKNITTLLHPTEINVLSNHFDFCLYQSDAILESIEKNELILDINQFFVQLSCQAVLDEKKNICSTRISVQYINYPTLNTTITLDTSLTEKIVKNYFQIKKYFTSIKELLP